MVEKKKLLVGLEPRLELSEDELLRFMSPGNTFDFSSIRVNDFRWAFEHLFEDGDLVHSYCVDGGELNEDIMSPSTYSGVRTDYDGNILLLDFLDNEKNFPNRVSIHMNRYPKFVFLSGNSHEFGLYLSEDYDPKLHFSGRNERLFVHEYQE